MSSTDQYEEHVLCAVCSYNFEELLDCQLDAVLVNIPEIVLNWQKDQSTFENYVDGIACSDNDIFIATLDVQTTHTLFTENCFLQNWYKRANWTAIRKSNLQNPFDPYCYSNVDELLRQWYACFIPKSNNLHPESQLIEPAHLHR